MIDSSYIRYFSSPPHALKLPFKLIHVLCPWGYRMWNRLHSPDMIKKKECSGQLSASVVRWCPL